MTVRTVIRGKNDFQWNNKCTHAARTVLLDSTCRVCLFPCSKLFDGCRKHDLLIRPVWYPWNLLMILWDFRCFGYCDGILKTEFPSGLKKWNRSKIAMFIPWLCNRVVNILAGSNIFMNHWELVFIYVYDILTAMKTFCSEKIRMTPSHHPVVFFPEAHFDFDFAPARPNTTHFLRPQKIIYLMGMASKILGKNGSDWESKLKSSPPRTYVLISHGKYW